MKIWKGVGWVALLSLLAQCVLPQICICIHNWVTVDASSHPSDSCLPLFPALFLTDMYYCHIPTISYAVICIQMTRQEMNRFVDIFKVFSSSKFELFWRQNKEKLLSINYNVNIGLKVKKMRHFPANFVLWFKFCPFFGCGGLEVQENFFEFQTRPR